MTKTQSASVELRFSEPVEIDIGSVRVLDASGHRADVGQVDHPGGHGDQVGADLRPGLAEGTYLVLWRVVSADSHPVSGSFTFSIGHRGAVASADEARIPTVTSVASGTARFVEYLAVLCLVGSLAFAGWCWRAGWTTRRLRTFLHACLVASGIAAVADFAFQAATDLGAGPAGAWDVAALRALAGTQFGIAHIVRLGLVVGIAVLVGTQRNAPARVQSALLALGSLGILVTIAVDGHAGAGPDLEWRLPTDIAHVGAVAVWVGGLASLVVMLSARRSRPVRRRPTPSPVLVGAHAATAVQPADEHPTSEADPLESEQATLSTYVTAVRRFSTIAAGCVVVIVATGVAQAWYEVREWGALTGTRYGHLIIVKAVLLALILAVAAVSRDRVRRLRQRPATVRRLVSSVGVEGVIAVAVLAVTAALVNAPPATSAYRPAVERTLQAGPVTVQLSAVPAGAHIIDLHVYTFGSGGLLRDVPALRIRADDPDQPGANTINAPVSHLGTGHFVANHWLLPGASTWHLQLIVQVDDFDAFTADTTLRVR